MPSQAFWSPIFCHVYPTHFVLVLDVVGTQCGLVLAYVFAPLFAVHSHHAIGTSSLASFMAVMVENHIICFISPITVICMLTLVYCNLLLSACGKTIQQVVIIE